MNGSLYKSKNSLNQKYNKKLREELQRIVKSDSSLIKKLNITVYKEDFNEEKQHFFIAPSMFINSHDRLINQSSTDNASSIIEKSTVEKESMSPCDPDLMNYPNSSDFDDDE